MIQTFTSNKPGPNIVIMAGVHGDEPCGLQAFADILPIFRPRIGRVTFVIGNPMAVAVHTREFEENLNRMFRREEAMTEAEKATYEYRRSRELIPILRQADALLDIHSSTTVTTKPFIICEPQSYACAASLPAEIVVSGIDVLHQTGTDAFVNESGGLGICIECGNHNDPSAKGVAMSAIKNFLYFFGVSGFRSCAVPQTQLQTHIQANWLYKNSNTFTLSRKYEEFEAIKKGTVIGRDGVNDIIAPYDGYILFPHNRTAPDAEAFIFGVHRE